MTYHKTNKTKSKWVAYNNYYNNPYEDAYAYHDIDLHHDEIAYKIQRDDLENTRYVICKSELKHKEINVPGFKHGTKVKISRVPGVAGNESVELKVNNSENYVNEFGIAISPYLQYEIGYDFQYDIVRVESIS